jgi:hypothetical protein
MRVDGPAADAKAAVATIRRVLGAKGPELYREPFLRLPLPISSFPPFRRI